jgi:hypothetical protein
VTEDEADAMARAIVRGLRPTARPGVDALVSMASTLDRTAGAMALREMQGEAREQRMADAVLRLEAHLAALSPVPQPGAPPKPSKPKTDAAMDELGAGFLGWLRLAPSRIVDGASEVVALARAHPKLALLCAPVILFYARVVAGWIPALSPLADLMEALMSYYSPAGAKS